MNTSDCFKQFIADYRPNWAPATLDGWETCAKLFCNWRRMGRTEITDVTLRDIADWCVWLADGRSNVTIQKLRIKIRALFSWAQDYGHVKINPCDLKKLPDLPMPARNKHAMALDQHQAILRWVSANRTTRWPWWDYACRTGWETGLRLSDVAMMQWSSYDLEDGLIRVVPFKTRQKKGKEVVIPIDGEYLEFMRELRRNPEKAWHAQSQFISPEMQAIYTGPDATILQYQFAEICRAAGVKATFKSYRHSFVSRLGSIGASSVMICSLTGLSIGTILNYTQVAVAAKRDTLNELRKMMIENQPKLVPTLPPVAV